MKTQYYLHTLTFNDYSTQFITSTTNHLNNKDEYRSIPRMIHHPQTKDANDS